MNGTRRRIFQRRRGATAALLVATLTAILGGSAMAVDFAVLYARKQAHVNGCDAAALAGGRELPEDQAAARARAVEAAGANGIAAPMGVTVSFPASNEIEVRSSENSPLFLGRIFGRTQTPVGARARAVIGVPNTVRGNAPTGLVPFGMSDDYYYSTVSNSSGTEVTLKLGSRSNSGSISNPGNFYPLRLLNGDKGANDYRDRVRYGASGVFRVGQFIDTEPGNMSGPTRQAVNGRLLDSQQSPWWQQTPSSYTMDNPRIIIMPIMDWDQGGNGQTMVPIVGFAAFWLTQTNGQEVKGYHLTSFVIDNGDVDPTTPPPAMDSGLRVVRLVE